MTTCTRTNCSLLILRTNYETEYFSKKTDNRKGRHKQVGSAKQNYTATDAKFIPQNKDEKNFLQDVRHQFYPPVWELRSLFRVIGLLHIIGLCSHTCVTCSSALCSGSWRLFGPPTASLAYQARVYCGCKPGPTRVLPMPRQYGIGSQSASPTYVGDELRFQGDVVYRRVILQPVSNFWIFQSQNSLSVHKSSRSTAIFPG